MKTYAHAAHTISTLLLLLVLQVTADAQIGNPRLIYQSAANNAMFLATKNAIARNRESQAASNSTPTETSSAKSAATLSFIYSPQVHAKVVQSMARMMSQENNTKEDTNVALLNKADLLGEFDHLLRKYGLDSHNLPDVFSAYVILSWQVVTGNDASKSPAGIEAFRKEIHKTMDNNTDMQKFTDQQKQETAETLSYLAVLSTLANQDLTKKGSVRQLNQIRANVRQAASRISGMDLTKYTLNQTGFHSVND